MGQSMSDQNLPKDVAPLTPMEYWQESIKTWAEFSQRSSKIVMNQTGGAETGKRQPLDPEADTLATEFLRTFSDMNLRHWQNTARLLESLPSWMRVPNNMTGSALVDWFDKAQRQAGLVATAQDASAPSPSEANVAAPQMLRTPDGEADDLTRIKGIGPKLSARLNELGIYHFKQIAGWSDTEARWVDEFLSFNGRVSRDAWIKQARVLSANGSATVH